MSFRDLRHPRVRPSRWALGVVAVAAASVCCAVVGIGSAVAKKAPTVKVTIPKGPIHVAVVGTDSGPLAFVGSSQKHGIQIALKAINGAGGVDGHKIVATFQDDGATVAQAGAVTRQLLQQGGYDAFFGAGESQVSESIEPLLNQARLITFLGSGVSTDINATTWPYIFRAYVTNLSQVVSLLQYLKSHHITRIAQYYDDTSYGVASAQSVAAALAGTGITVVNSASYAPTTSDFTSLATQAKGANAQVSVVWDTVVANLANLTKAFAQQQVPGQIVLSNAAFNQTFPPLVGSAGNGVIGLLGLTSTYNSKGKPVDPAMVDFIKKVNAIGGQDDLLALDENYYDEMRLYAAAVAASGSVKAVKVKAALEHMTDFPGIQGLITFTPKQHDGLPSNTYTMAKPMTYKFGGLYQQAG